jgi:hypothetical protein
MREAAINDPSDWADSRWGDRGLTDPSRKYRDVIVALQNQMPSERRWNGAEEHGHIRIKASEQAAKNFTNTKPQVIKQHLYGKQVSRFQKWDRSQKGA